MRNTFGQLFTLTTFGESHGPCIGGVVDGMPAGIGIDTAFVQSELCRRRPGQGAGSTTRHEADEIEWLSGVFEGKSTGTPIGFIIKNTNQHSSDYDTLRDIFRPSHADYTYLEKYGVRDHRGGGRSSARITAARVVGGALAKLALRPLGINIQAYTSSIGTVSTHTHYTEMDLSKAEQNSVRCPDAVAAAQMEQLINKVKAEGDTLGGIITCVVKGCPAGLGEPEFGKLHALLGSAMLSINAVKGFEYGDGFEAARKRGSEENDPFVMREGSVRTLSNHSGGIQGGISNGEDIVMRIAFKPIASIRTAQQTVDKEGNKREIIIPGRHDVCPVPRAVPIVEAMAAMTILDVYLFYNSVKLYK